MQRMIIAAASFMMASAAWANTPSVYLDGGSKAHIRFRDLDLQSQAGRDELGSRIRLAARMLCTVDSDPLTFGPTRSDCLQSVIARGDSAMKLIASR
jgi:UrcA family protein